MNVARILSQDTAKYFLLLGLLAVIWSSSFMMMKVGVETIKPITLTAFRLIIGGIVLWMVMAWRGEKLTVDGNIIRFCFLIGFFGNALPFMLISWGVVQIDSGLAAILMAVMPLVTVVLAHFFARGERLTLGQSIGIVIGFLGVVVLVGPEVFKELGGDIWRQIAVAGGAVSYALAAIFARNAPDTPLLPRAVWVMIMGSLIMVPLALVLDQPWLLKPSVDGLAATLYLGVLPTGIATVIFFKIIHAKGAGFVAFINYIIPVLGVGWGALFLNETLSWQALAALILILTGLVVANVRWQTLQR